MYRTEKARRKGRDMPQAYYGHPNKVARVDGKLTVFYPDTDRTPRVDYLQRQDLLRVASTMANDLGVPFSGVKLRNDQVRTFIENCSPWEKEAKKLPPVEDIPEDDGRVKTKVRCKCGHDYNYRINAKRFEATKTWLEGKDCPKCAKDGDMPKPKPQDSEPEEQDDSIEEAMLEEPESPKEEKVLTMDGVDLDKLADMLVQKVQERLKPVEMPKLHHEVLPEVIKCLAADVPVWLQGPPGTSKSTIGQQAAESLGLAFHAISCHEGMTSSHLFGYTDAHGVEHRTPLWDAFENGGLLLLDEIDNGNANILAALNSALSNGFCVFAGKTVTKHPDFKVLAAANTAGMGPEAGFIGRMGVDLATLDRFVTIRVDIDNKLESAIVKAICPDQARVIITAVRKLRKAVDARGLRVVVSPRTSIHTARMVKAGVTLENSLRRTALKGVDETTAQGLLDECIERGE